MDRWADARASSVLGLRQQFHGTVAVEQGQDPVASDMAAMSWVSSPDLRQEIGDQVLAHGSAGHHGHDVPFVAHRRSRRGANG